jgi:hypothetical protein
MSRGPCNDQSVKRELLAKALAKVRPKRLLADADYDAEGCLSFVADGGI